MQTYINWQKLVKEMANIQQRNRAGNPTVFLFSHPVKIKLCGKPWLLAQCHTKLMDQRAGAQHMKPIYFKGCL